VPFADGRTFGFETKYRSKLAGSNTEQCLMNASAEKLMPGVLIPASVELLAKKF